MVRGSFVFVTTHNASLGTSPSDLFAFQLPLLSGSSRRLCAFCGACACACACACAGCVSHDHLFVVTVQQRSGQRFPRWFRNVGYSGRIFIPHCSTGRIFVAKKSGGGVLCSLEAQRIKRRLRTFVRFHRSITRSPLCLIHLPQNP